MTNERRASLDLIAAANGRKTVDQLRKDILDTNQGILDTMPNWLTDKEKRKILKMERKLLRRDNNEST